MTSQSGRAVTRPARRYALNRIAAWVGLAVALGLSPAVLASPATETPVCEFADLHAHQFSNLAFGGVMFQGAPFSPDGNIGSALPHCDILPPCSIAPPLGLPVVVDALGLPVLPCPLNLFCPLPLVCPGPTCPAACSQCPIQVPICLPDPLCNPFDPDLDPLCLFVPCLFHVDTCPPTPTSAIPAHGPGGVIDLMGNAVSIFNGGNPTRYLPGHPVGGYPEFDGWPRWDTSTHQQMYYEWLHRAFQGGLKLMVMQAVNNEALCRLANKRPDFGCNDMAAVDRQIQGAKDLEQFIDNQNGGPGRGWYQIAYSGRQARAIIDSGKMAVVLGAEVDSLFDCYKNNATCDETHVRNELQRYYDLGLRHVFPLHIADNRFGGAALYTSLFNFNNKIITGDYWDVGGCPADSGVDFHLDLFDTVNDETADVATALTLIHASALLPPEATPFADALLPAFALLGLTNNLPHRPPAGPNCNARGLTPLGELLVNQMMDKKMIIDVDHSSVLALNRMLEIAEQRHYPAIVMGHTGFIENNKPGVNKKHEGNKTARQVERVRALGGLVAVILHQGKVSEIEQSSSRIPNDCGVSSKTWAQAYLYAADKMKGGAVAFGSDFNGLAGEPAPRFGEDACAGERLGDQGTPFSYPFRAHGTTLDMDRMGAGSRVLPFDYNYDGMANVGMYPDFVNDLKAIGLTDADLNPLCNSADAYVTMWEKAENNPPVARTRNVTVNAGPDCTAKASIDNGSFDPDGDPITLSQSPGGPYGTGTTLVTLTVTDSFGASSTSTAMVTVVDDTLPSITGVSVDQPVLWPPNHQTRDVTVTYNVSDNCQATCSLGVTSNEPADVPGAGHSSPDWEVVDAHHVRLVAERSGMGTGRVYTIAITCSDGSGNTSEQAAIVSVPLNPIP